MNIHRKRQTLLGVLAIALVATLPARRAAAYVEAPHSLGKIVASSTLIVLVRVKEVDRTKNTIIYTKVREIRGSFEGEIKHNIGQRGFHPREWKNVMAWARVGKPALFFTNGGHGEMCIENYWYQAGYKGWSTMTHAEPYFLRAFAGRPEKLANYVTQMLAGNEVVVPCLVDGDKMAIQERTAKVQRMRASLKLGDYNPKRDFVGWGAEDFRPISGMPGFTHIADIGKFSPGASAAVKADYNGDGKTDLCIFGDYRVALLKNEGGLLSEEALPISSGARSAAWGDYDSNGKPDLLLATSSGAKLLFNNVKQFLDRTADLPLGRYDDPRAVAWIDYDGDKRLDVLLADGFRGLRLYRNVIPKGQSATAPATTQPAAKPLFVDVSDAVGLGAAGLCANAKGDCLTIADFNGDGRSDILYSAGTGMLLLNATRGFVLAKSSGISYRSGGVTPALGDYNRDGRADILVPQTGSCKLFRNDGQGKFSDVTAASGDLANAIGTARSAAWCDFDKDSRLDILVGCLKGPNRYFRSMGDGTFKDHSENIGLMYRMFNTSGLTVADINTDDMPDLVFNNEGQPSVVLLGSPAWTIRAASQASTPKPVKPPVASSRMMLKPPAAAPSIGPSGGGQTPYWIGAIILAGFVAAGLVLAKIRHWRIHPVTRAVASACLLLAIASSSWAAPPKWSWPTHRGNTERTGCLDGTKGPQKPNVQWVYKSPEHFIASIVPGDKAIYAGGLGAFNTGVVHAISSDLKPTERVSWSKVAPYIKRPTVCAPAVYDGTLIFGDGMHQTNDALMYCVTEDTGLPVWSYSVPGKLVHIEGAPTVDRDRVYFGAGAAGVICLDSSHVTIDGKTRSRREAIGIISAKWAEMNAAYQAEKKKNPELAIPPSAEALPKAEPRLRWQVGKNTWHVDAPIATAGEYVFVASAFLDLEKVGKRSLLCLKASSGEVVWDAKLDLNPWSGPTIAGPVVIVGCSSIRFDRKEIPKAAGQVVALNVADGRVLWSQKTPGGVLSSVAVKDGLAIWTCTDGKIYARKFLTGQPVWTYDAKIPFFAGAALAGKTVYAADLKSIVHAVDLTTGKRRWVFDIGSDPSVQARGTVFGSPVVHGGNLYVGTCNLDGATDQPSVIVCLSDKPAAVQAIGKSITVDAASKTVTVPCRIGARKLATLKEVYPLEVIASLPYPRGQKAHETVLTFDVKPSDVHKAIESLGLKPGKPAKGVGAESQGPEVSIYLQFAGITGKMRTIPIFKTLVDTRTGRPMPPLKWRFTGSAMRKRDPNKPDLTFGADLTGTLISIFPVTDETVFQSNMTLAEESLLKLETNKSILPPEGQEVNLIIKVMP